MPLILFLLFLLIAAPAPARTLTAADGLPSNTVRSMSQDKFGFIWLATDNGLCRYDGARVQTWRIRELGLSQYVSAVLAVDEGVYVGTEQGVFFFSFKDNSYRRLPTQAKTVAGLALDKEGNIWIATYGQGAFRYQPATGKSKAFAFPTSKGSVKPVYIDNTNQVWAIPTAGNNHLFKLQPLAGRFTRVPMATEIDATCMTQTTDGRLWLGTWDEGLWELRPDGTTVQRTAAGLHIHCLYSDDSTIYIGADDGIFAFNPTTGSAEQLGAVADPMPRFVYDIFRDAEGGIWFSTFYGGVGYLPAISSRFLCQGDCEEAGLGVISKFCETPDGAVWVASDDQGLRRYAAGHFSPYPHSDQLTKLNVHALCADAAELWIGTYASGIYRLNTSTGNLRHWPTIKGETDPLASSYAIFKAKDGTVWIATSRRVYTYDPKADSFTPRHTFGALAIDIAQTDDGALWFATQGDGVWSYARGRWQHYTQSHSGLYLNDINTLCVADDGQLWAGMLGGLCRYDAKTKAFRRVQSAMPAKEVAGIVEAGGVLWLSTNHGIMRYQTNGDVRYFTAHDGLVSNMFRPAAALRTSDGQLWFGSISGFNHFQPYAIKTNATPPPVYITSVDFYGQDDDPDLAQQARRMSPCNGAQAILDYDEARTITVTFASLSYCTPEKNQYRYMLEGFDKDWLAPDQLPQATYTNLPAGTYTFRLRATNNDGLWADGEATLTITINPPLWWTWWAKTIYCLLIIGIILLYVHLRLEADRRRHEADMQLLSERKEKEVRDARLNFFTMIAHEIRTPVSLIIGPLEKIRDKDDNLRIIDRNAHRLLDLVNQLLDFRKVEQQKLVMHFKPCNIADIIDGVADRFAPTFRQNNVEFTVRMAADKMTAIVDAEGVTKVISNLLTNARKYTKSRVELRCAPEPDMQSFRIEVEDDGVGIRQEDQKRIFEAFYQSEDNKPGTGIGLNIVKNIVAQHGGTVTVKSEVGLGSTFKVSLPMKQDIITDEPAEAQQVAKASEPAAAPAAAPARKSSVPTMLVVDDSPDMVEFLRTSFDSTYKVFTAADGIEALDQLAKHNIDIIVSDWMMPRLDGPELCKRVRASLATSHIPFIMLTAKTDDASKLEGANIGADAYIEKPFSVDYLTASIANILKMRQTLMRKYSTSIEPEFAAVAPNSPLDNEFLAKMTKLIEDNLGNTELSVLFLADHLNISRSGLFTKLKALTDVTPNEMIQTVRLKRAAQLLAEGRYLVSEVCYMVGFSNPSYFTKCFTKQFGQKPADFAKQGRGGR